MGVDVPLPKKLNVLYQNSLSNYVPTQWLRCTPNFATLGGYVVTIATFFLFWQNSKAYDIGAASALSLTTILQKRELKTQSRRINKNIEWGKWVAMHVKEL